MMSGKLGVGTFAHYEDMELALGELKDDGFMMERVSLVGRGMQSQTDVTGVHTSDRLMDGENLHTDDNKAGGTAADGAIAGGTVGGFAGLLIGLGLLAVPGFGPFIMAGATATAIATALSGSVIGAAAGSLAGGLMGLGIPEDQAETYADQIDRGDYLVMVRGEDGAMDLVISIFDKYHIKDWYVYEQPNEDVGSVPVTANPEQSTWKSVPR